MIECICFEEFSTCRGFTVWMFDKERVEHTDAGAGNCEESTGWNILTVQKKRKNPSVNFKTAASARRK